MSAASLLLAVIALALAIAASVSPPWMAFQLAACACQAGAVLRRRSR